MKGLFYVIDREQLSEQISIYDTEVSQEKEEIRERYSVISWKKRAAIPLSCFYSQLRTEW